ncbi:MAG: D-aminoacyl-tRNA deacylase [Gammaproteobacteria bacterium]|nr:D-aminoacyl-tRNA deacylase [Gammaproteobacteria bacterium]
MILLIQRVSEALVHTEEGIVGKIGRGLLAFVAVEPGDDDSTARRLVERVVAYRVFNDEAGRMNLSLADTGGELLLVSQFTLAADTGKGLRPSFTTAAAPDLGRRLFDRVVGYAREALPGRVATGRFGAEMKVSLVNDGPVTFWLQFPAGATNES